MSCLSWYSRRFGYDEKRRRRFPTRLYCGRRNYWHQIWSNDFMYRWRRQTNQNLLFKIFLNLILETRIETDCFCLKRFDIFIETIGKCFRRLKRNWSDITDLHGSRIIQVHLYHVSIFGTLKDQRSQHTCILLAVNKCWLSSILIRDAISLLWYMVTLSVYLFRYIYLLLHGLINLEKHCQQLFDMRTTTQKQCPLIEPSFPMIFQWFVTVQ